jgi:hypothetical protein
MSKESWKGKASVSSIEVEDRVRKDAREPHKSQQESQQQKLGRITII